MKKTYSYIASLILLCVLPSIGFSHPDLQSKYEEGCMIPSDFCEHVPTLRILAGECSSVAEIGLRGMVSTWGLLAGLAENSFEHPSYLGIDLNSPPPQILSLARKLAQEEGIVFRFVQDNDMNIHLPQVDMLFIDSLHIYCHLTYELEEFCSQVSKYIVMHDTSAPFGERDQPYDGDYSEYPSWINRNKRGLWPAVTDFLEAHPEWALLERHLNCHGLTILKRVSL